ncbi:hypothetical protein JAAARDRAFT_190554 [Jaapia argillacea MUCL 33604]|uniref:CHAT domain-containing protein n=1 Tax=Jaapia argillacea MUCL 33604 TaxID=933084 RepID=A0A067Q6Q1_9AGAM|nr:hypothetical protein JAAARDRAFT_190554 [Jaapia argillacea MUCL 33604]
MENRLLDVERAIAYLWTIFNVDLERHWSFPSVLYYIGYAYLQRHEILGDPQDLEEAASKLSDAVYWTPLHHSLRGTILETSADASYLQFQWSGEESYLRDCILWLEEAIELLDPITQLRPQLQKLARFYLVLFEKTEDQVDGDRAVELFTQAQLICPRRDTREFLALTFELADAFHAFYENTTLGVAHLETAISHRRAAISLAAAHGTYPSADQLVTLSNELHKLYQYSGRKEYLDESISFIQQSAVFQQDPMTRASLFSSLGTLLGLRLQLSGSLADAPEAIEAFRNSKSLHEELGVRWNSLEYATLGLVSFELHNKSHSPGDIGQAILCFRNAVELSKKDGDIRYPQIFRLGLALYASFKVHGSACDLDEAINHLRTLAPLSNKGIVGKSAHRLAVALHARFELSKSRSDLDECLEILARVCGLPIESLNHRRTHFDCAALLASLAMRHGRLDLSLQGFQRAVDMLPHVFLKGSDVASRQKDLSSHAVDLACDAASCAIELGRLDTAVDLLERGRSAFWSHNLVIHPDLTSLQVAHPNLIKEFERANKAAIDAQATVTAHHTRSFTTSRQTPGELLERYRRIEDDSYHAQLIGSPEELRLNRAVEQSERCLDTIRKIPEFQSFLRPAEISELMKGTVDRNVVMINISRLRCDALVLQHGGSPSIRLVPLPDASYDKVAALSKHMQNVLGMANVRVRESEALRHMKPPRIRSAGVPLPAILSHLWSWIVHPILKALSLDISSHPPRLFWCPTGPLTYLPLHAAGFYSRTDVPDRGLAVYDYVVSSYIPSLRALIRPTPVDIHVPRVLIVSQPETPGQKSIPMTIQEVTKIVEIAKPLVPISVLDGADATVSRVTAALTECDWCHFACHGTQDPNEPLHSGLVVQDGLVSIDRILSLKISTSHFAFLSACQTASNDTYFPNESLHITASLLYAGFGGVIGSLWSISDSDAPAIAEGVYVRMLAHPALSSEDAARALHESVGRLRESGASLERWAPFVHFGL